MKKSSISSWVVRAGVTAAIGIALSTSAYASTTLSGLKLFSTDATGRDSGIGSQVWATPSGGGPSKLWVIRGTPDDAFLNGPSNAAAAINIPLTNGRHTFTIYGAPGAEKDFFGLNLFFNGASTKPNISIFAAPHRNASAPPPAFSADGAMTQQLNTSTLVAGANTMTFVDGPVTVKLVSYFWALPTVFNRDRVGRQQTGADGAADFIGQFELEISGAVRTPQISNGGVVNGASFATKVAPGSLITIFGIELSSGASGASAVPLPTSLLDTAVTVAGKPMPLTYVSATQINAQLPYDTPLGMQAVVVKSDGASSSPIMVDVAAVAPGVFQFGANRAVVQNDDYSVNNTGNGAKAGSYIIAYLTGGGELDNPVPTGEPAGADPLSRLRYQVSAAVGGKQAVVAFAGMTPSFIGLVQVNLQIPNVVPDTYPLIVSVDGVPSNAALVTVK